MSRLFSGTPFDQPKPCPTCGLPPAQCRCLALPPKNQKAKIKNQNSLDSGLTLTPQNSSPPPDQLAKSKLEKRHGRTLTLILGLDHPANDLPALCTHLRQALATGGSVQEQNGRRTIELQGDQSQKLPALLTAQNLKSRLL